MSVELPKDTEGREIPLDTKVLYDSDGAEFFTDKLMYMRIIDKWWFFGHFGSLTSTHRIEATKLHLTPPDSWEKLEKDLSIVEDFKGTPYLDSPACAYTHNIGKSCGECKFYGGTPCVGKMCADIASRIHKLRGED